MVFVDVGLGEAVFGAADLGRVDARGQLFGFVGALATGEGVLEALHGEGAIFGELLQLGAEFVLQDAARHAQLLEVGEVAQQGHVGIRWVVGPHGLVVVPTLLSCCHEAQVGAQQHTLEVAAWC